MSEAEDNVGAALAYGCILGAVLAGLIGIVLIWAFWHLRVV